MTKNYRVHARCLRPFVSWLDIQADTPEEALAQAREEEDELIASAQDGESWPWDEFTVFDDDGDAVLRRSEPESTSEKEAAERLALEGLLASAENLLAAIQDATGQFDDECTALDAACTAARSAARGQDGFPIHELLAGRRQIALVWSLDDVLQVRPDLSAAQAWTVLQAVERRHDASAGVTWQTLADAAEDLFGPAGDTDAA